MIDTELRKELQEHLSLLPQRNNGVKLFEQKPQLHLPAGTSFEKGQGSEQVDSHL